jgi:glucan biosynthesis protein C
MQTQIGSRPGYSISQKAGRIHYLDSLRVLAVLMVFLFHASKAFTAGEWHIMNAETSMVATVIFDAFLAPWGMPFFFLLAGAGTWFALQRRSARQFAGERFGRLLIPFLIGSALFTPFQAFFEYRFQVRAEDYTGSYLQFILERWGGWNPTIANFLGYHLWFLIFLFMCSLLALPVLIWLRDRGQDFVVWSSKLWDHRGGLLIFALPPLLFQVILRPFFPGSQNWADFFYDLFFFLSGYLIFANEGFVQAIRRDRWLALGVGSAALLGLMATLALGQAEALFSIPETPSYRLFWGLASVDAWCWSIFMLSIGMRFLDFSNQWTRYGQEAIVPFYLFHQPVIVAVAFFVVQWQAGVAVKMLAVVIISFAITAAIYELIVRRLQPLRAIFGMKAAFNLPSVPLQESTLTSRSDTRPSA